MVKLEPFPGWLPQAHKCPSSLGFPIIQSVVEPGRTGNAVHFEGPSALRAMCIDNELTRDQKVYRLTGEERV